MSINDVSESAVRFRKLALVSESTISRLSDGIYAFNLTRGSFGKVMLCYDIDEDVIFIRKVMAPDADIDYMEMAFMTFLKQHCVQSVICLRKITITDLDISKQVTYDMEFLGFSIDSFIKQNRKTLTDIDIAIIARKLVRGLEYLHSLGVVHKDIKPANIVINPNTVDVKYIDFGLSCMRDVSRLNSILKDSFGLHADAISYQKNNEWCNSFSGTPNFMSPELIKRDVSSFSDLIPVDYWALGVSLYWIFLSKYPIKGTSQGELIENITSFNQSKLRQNFDQDASILKTIDTSSPLVIWIYRLIERMMNSKPFERKPTTKMLGSELWLAMGQTSKFSEFNLELAIQSHIDNRITPPVKSSTKIVSEDGGYASGINGPNLSSARGSISYKP